MDSKILEVGKVFQRQHDHAYHGTLIQEILDSLALEINLYLQACESAGLNKVYFEFSSLAKDLGVAVRSGVDVLICADLFQKSLS